jgi:hypothetical protein
MAEIYGSEESFLSFTGYHYTDAHNTTEGKE